MDKYYTFTISEGVMKMIPEINSLYSVLLGITACPLLLIGIYFYKVNPAFFEKEHLIALGSMLGGLVLLSVSTYVSNLGIALASMQMLPVVNHLFVRSFQVPLAMAVPIGLSFLSIYFAMVGYKDASIETPLPLILSLSLAVMAAIFCIRAFDLFGYIKPYIKDISLSDAGYTTLYTAESSYAFVTSVALFYWAGVAHPLVYILTNASIMIPIEKALYYHPATVVMPIFAVMIRFGGAAISTLMLRNSLNPAVVVSLFCGLVASFFPLIIAI